MFIGKNKNEESRGTIQLAKNMTSESNELFFGLIRVSIGAQDVDDFRTYQEHQSFKVIQSQWRKLYEISQKQSVLGVCFVGVSRLSNPDCREYAGMSEDLYYNWAAVALQIQKRNEKMNRACSALQSKVSSYGFRSCILKGQGIAGLYLVSENSADFQIPDLKLLRQSGDIDLWCDASKDEIVSMANEMGSVESPGYLHIGTIFNGEPVEFHFRPSYMRNPLYNARLRRFCSSHKEDWIVRDGIVVPSLEFDAVYLLSHIYRHLFGAGIGLRQLMDYYFLVRSLPDSFDFREFRKRLKYLGIYHFAGAVMWVMKAVFGMAERYLPVDPDAKRGCMLLSDIMKTGNFGRMDEEQKSSRSNPIGTIVYKVRQWWKLLWYYPEEALFEPLWRIVKVINNIVI